MKKSIWIFLLAVLLPSAVLGWLALRSAEEQQIVFERRTAELYQKETEALAVTVREAVESERRIFGETVHRLLANGDPEALAHDFSNTLADAWPQKAIGFALDKEGKLVSPTAPSAARNPEWGKFLLDNGSFLSSSEAATVYAVSNDAGNRAVGGYARPKISGTIGWQAARGVELKQKSEMSAAAPMPEMNAPAQPAAGALAQSAPVVVSGTVNAIAELHSAKGDADSPVDRGTISVPGFANADKLLADAEHLNKKRAQAALEGTVGGKILAMDSKNEPSADTRTANGKPDAIGRANEAPSVTPAPAAAGPPAPSKPTESDGNSRPTTASAALPSGPKAPAKSAQFGMAMKDGIDRLSAAKEREEKGADSRLPEASKVDPSATSPSRTEALLSKADDQRKLPGGRASNVPPGLPSVVENRAADTDPQKREIQPPVEPTSDGKLQRMESSDEAAKDVGAGVGGLRGLRMGTEDPTALTAPAAPNVPVASKPGTTVAATKAQFAEMAESRDRSQAGKKLGLLNEQREDTQALLRSDGTNPMPAAPPVLETQSNLKDTSFRRKMPDQQEPKENDGTLEQAAKFSLNRQVEPQQLLGAPGNALSMLVPATAEFRAITGEGEEGIVSRFVQDKLNLIFWLRPPEAPDMIFGCLIEAGNFGALWKGVLDRHHAASRSSYEGSDSQPGFVLALLDDRGHPAATGPAVKNARDWKRPFVASEIGEALPHWEAALYLASPTALADSARGLWRTLAFTIAGAVALIALGGWLVVADARRQLALAQQKTDFVSNVSHELKTPLTSIRMFAELMHDRPQPPEKQGQYLRIITVEAERLTRLINNVLDFAKIGRKQKRLEKRSLDLHEVISRVWESQELHLREAGFTTRWEAEPAPYLLLGDDDALAQLLVNLLSNAEKYSTDRREVELHTWIEDGWVNVSVLDRGMGVPNGEERKIFESFYRAHDSLSSGIQGSGLGLTLALRVAHEHGGEIKFERRDGGGSRFTLRLPIHVKAAAEPA